MDLKLKDVAQLLRVTEPQVQRWLEESNIPAYQFADEVRFNRTELESWLIRRGPPHPQQTQSEPIDAAIEQSMLKYDLYRAVYHGDVCKDFTGSSKESIIKQTTTHLAKKCPIQAETLYDLLIARERLMSTGLGQGVAVPHTRDFLLDTHFDVICVVYPEEPLEYQAIDRQKVHTLFFLFACSDRTHLHLLAKIASFCQHKPHLKLLQTRPDKPKLLDAILRWEKQL